MNEQTANDDVMTLKDLAEYLKVHPTTIYRLVKRGRIPAFRVGSDWRFIRGEIERWCREQEESARAS